MRTVFALGFALLFTATGCASTAPPPSQTTVRSGTPPKGAKQRRGRHVPRFTTQGDLNQMSTSDSSARANENARDRFEREFLMQQGRDPDEIYYDKSLDPLANPAANDVDRAEREREREEPVPPVGRPNPDDERGGGREPQ